MAFIQITTSVEALNSRRKQELSKRLGALVYTAEGFGGSRLAPFLTWVAFEELPAQSMLLGTGERPAPLYYVRVTALADALDASSKEKLGADITRVLLEEEGAPLTPDHATRVWVRFMDVSDGDLIVGGNATSLQGLKALVAQAG